MRAHRGIGSIAVSETLVACATALLVACGGRAPTSPGAASPSAGTRTGPAAGSVPATDAAAGRLDAARLAGAASEPGQWFTSGRDQAGTYFSPLTRINTGNVAQLGFAWQFVLDTNRGLEATPIVIDGVMYAAGNWGRVYALDARSGRELWRHVPAVDGQWARHACCDVVNRGLAVWQGRVYVGTIDGWLEALDARTGAVAWRVDTLVGREQRAPYTVSGAPLIAGDVVIIGNGGADFGVRGYVSAYDLASGALRWRFYTVPRDPALGPQDQPHLEKAAATWDPKGEWRAGAGGTVWDGMAYDPALKLVYLGTGNASPYDWKTRSPRGGDNLYLASIVAVHVQDGSLAWYYQQVPGERWDYTATMKMILAELEIGGRPRKVLMQAPKDGFFYVLDRATGELLSAKNFSFVNWTKGIDPKSGRPIPNPTADYHGGAKLVYPSQAGAHNWQPMSFSPDTGLVYIPTIDMPMVYIDTAKRPAGLVEGAFTVPGIPPEAYDPAGMRSLFGALPALDELAKRGGDWRAPKSRGELRAWDPIAGRIVWAQPGVNFWDGGVMSTAGGLVFRGDAAGFLNVYAATDGKQLAHLEVGSSIMAAPMSYSIDGEQYVAVMAGYGGGGGFAFPPDSAAYQRGNQGRILVFRLGGGAVPLPPRLVDAPMPQPPASSAAAATIANGEVLYNRYCGRCHVFGRGLLPDLRRMSTATHAIFQNIVFEGAYIPKGMGRWDDVLTRADVEAIHAYIIAQAEAQWRAEQTSH
jgi:quinohemoprotein ethanol dehydrogenase